MLKLGCTEASPYLLGPFLLSWMPEVVSLGLSKDFLTLLVNFVHYNAAYMDVEVLVGVVRSVT